MYTLLSIRIRKWKHDDTMGSVELLKVPEIVSESEAITVVKNDGTKVSYYIFPEFEVHANTIVAGINVLWLEGSHRLRCHARPGMIKLCPT